MNHSGLIKSPRSDEKSPAPVDHPALDKSPQSPHQPSQRQQSLALLLMILFLAIIICPPIYQFYYQWRFAGHLPFSDWPMLADGAHPADNLERSLTNDSRFNRWIRQTIAAKLSGFKNAAFSSVVPGTHGFFFLREEVKTYQSFSLVDPPPASTAQDIPAILDYHRQLRARHIHLVVLPVPMKTMIYPERLWPQYTSEKTPAYPPGYEAAVKELVEQGVDVLDIAPLLYNAKAGSRESLFVPDDTHWSWKGRSIAADALTDHLRPMIVDCPHIQLDIVKTESEERHDLTSGGVSADGSSNPPTHFLADAVYRNGKPFSAGDEAPILLLGDSYAALNSKTGHGFEHELMMRLNVEVQSISEPGYAASGSRLMLLQAHRTALNNKKVVIWEFAARYLWSDPPLVMSLPPETPLLHGLLLSR